MEGVHFHMPLPWGLRPVLFMKRRLIVLLTHRAYQLPYTTNTVAFILHYTFLIFALSSCINSPFELVHQIKRMFKTSIAAPVCIHIDFFAVVIRCLGFYFLKLTCLTLSDYCNLRNKILNCFHFRGCELKIGS